MADKSSRRPRRRRRGAPVCRATVVTPSAPRPARPCRDVPQSAAPPQACRTRVSPKLLGAHVGVAVAFPEALVLPLARGPHAVAHRVGSLPRSLGEVLRCRPLDRHLDVDAIREGAAQLRPVARDRSGMALALPRIGAVAAATGFEAATSMKLHGSEIEPLTRVIVTRPCSSGWRRASRASRRNSPSSSRNRTPRCARRHLARPRAARRPPINDRGEAVWWGARKGRAGEDRRPRSPLAPVITDDLERLGASRAAAAARGACGRPASCRHRAGR